MAMRLKPQLVLKTRHADKFQMSLSSHLLDNVPALFARHGLLILRSDPFNLSAVGGFAVAGIACDHAIFVQEMQVLMLALASPLRFHLECPVLDFI